MLYKEAYKKLYSLRQTTAEVLAAAVCELYPNIEIKGASVDEEGFSYAFVFPDFSSSFLDPIERKMKEIIQKQEKVEVKVMVFASAKGYLEHLGLKRQLLPVSEYTFVEIGSFVDLASSYQVQNTGEIKYFSLSGFEKKGKNQVLIKGWSYLDKDSLKKAKKLPAEKSSVFLNEGNFLNEKGIRCKEILIRSWRKLVKEAGFSLLEPLDSECKIKVNHPTSELGCKEQEIEEKNPTLFQTVKKTVSRERFFTEQELISYLQFLEKWLKLLELESCSVILFRSKKKEYRELKKALTKTSLLFRETEGNCREKLALFVEDSRQRAWEVISLEKEDSWIGKLYSMERVLGLLEEKKEDYWNRVVAQIGPNT